MSVTRVGLELRCRGVAERPFEDLAPRVPLVAARRRVAHIDRLALAARDFDVGVLEIVEARAAAIVDTKRRREPDAISVGEWTTTIPVTSVVVEQCR